MIIDNSEVEGEESFVVHLRLLGPSRPSATLGPKSDVTITIVDDDQQPTEPPGKCQILHLVFFYHCFIYCIIHPIPKWLSI